MLGTALVALAERTTRWFSVCWSPYCVLYPELEPQLSELQFSYPLESTGTVAGCSFQQLQHRGLKLASKNHPWMIPMSAGEVYTHVSCLSCTCRVWGQAGVTVGTTGPSPLLAEHNCFWLAHAILVCFVFPSSDPLPKKLLKNSKS